MLTDEKKSATGEARVHKSDEPKKRKPKATKKPKAKKDAKPKKAKAPKPAKGKKPNKAERKVTAEDAKAQAESLVKLFVRFEKLRDGQRSIAKDAGDEIKRSYEALKAEFEDGFDYANGMPSEAIAKMKRFAVKWQNFTEAKAESAQKRRDAAKAAREAFKAVSQAVEETRQMSFRW